MRKQKPKELTYVQKLEEMKRKYHEEQHKSRYPNGVFSIQIRYGMFGWKKPTPEHEEKHVQLRWGVRISPQHWGTNFCIGKNVNGELITRRINNSFDNTYNYNNLDALLRKCDRENVDQPLIDAYTNELKKRGVK
jgi:hypothetical protein